MTLPTKAEVAPDAPKVLSEVRIDEDEWFEACEDGLYFRERKHTEKGAKTIAKRLTFARFEIVGRMVPIDDDQIHGLLVRAGDRELAVSADVATEADVVRWLRAKGVRFDYTGKTLLALYFSAASARAVSAYTRNGWQRDGAFVVGETVIRGEGRVMTTDAVISTFDVKGTYEEWREKVLGPAHAKPGWVLGILLGMSTPLLRVVEIATGAIINGHGRSSIGKTTLLASVANCCGCPDEDGCLWMFNFTVNGIEGLTEAHSDIGLPIDEMQNSDLELVLGLIYTLSNHQGKVAMKSSREMRHIRKWRCLAFISTEKIFEDIFDAADKQQAGGQVVRAIDINAEALLPEIPIGQVRVYEKALKSCYAVAGPEFVRRLMALPDGEAVRMWEEATVTTRRGRRTRLATVGTEMMSCGCARRWPASYSVGTRRTPSTPGRPSVGVVPRHDGIKGWTRKVPPKSEKSGVEFNLDRLRAIVHG